LFGLDARVQLRLLRGRVSRGHRVRQSRRALDSHTRTGADYDSTLNKLGDFDEEWNIEFAIPLRSLDATPTPGTRVSFTLHRCDMAFDGQRARGDWRKNDSPAELVHE
jgi:hypothetical protein